MAYKKRAIEEKEDLTSSKNNHRLITQTVKLWAWKLLSNINHQAEMRRYFLKWKFSGDTVLGHHDFISVLPNGQYLRDHAG